MRRVSLVLAFMLSISMLGGGSPAAADPVDDAVLLAEIAAEIAVYNANASANESLDAAECNLLSGRSEAGCAGDENDNIACLFSAAQAVVEPARTILSTVTVHPRDEVVGHGACSNPDITASGGPENFRSFMYLRLDWYDQEAGVWKIIRDLECINDSVAGQAQVLCNFEQTYSSPQDVRQYAPRQAYFELGFYRPSNGERVVRTTRRAGPLAPVVNVTCGCP